MTRMDDLRTARDILDHVENYQTARLKAQTRRDAGWFHPSSLSNPCDVAMALEYMGYSQVNTDPKLFRIFDLGHNRDKAWKSYIDESGLSYSRNDEDLKICIEDFRIRGECDALIEWNGQRYIGEFKTINSNGWSRLHRPKPEHVIQVQAYMFGHRVRTALVFYENKDTQEVKILPVPYYKDVWRKVVKRTEHIRAIVDAASTPQEALDQLERGCKYQCRYPDECGGICDLSEW